MRKLPIISGQKCVHALSKIGLVVRTQHGSHIILVRDDPKTRLSVPNHQTLDKGTLRAIIHKAGLTVDEFIDLLYVYFSGSNAGALEREKRMTIIMNIFVNNPDNPKILRILIQTVLILVFNPENPVNPENPDSDKV